MLFQTSNNFFYEDGQGNIDIEQRNDAMDSEEEIAPFNISSHLDTEFTQAGFPLSLCTPVYIYAI